jgi:hypothetical protein
MDNFDLKKFLAENRLLAKEGKEEKKGIVGRLLDKFKAKSPCHNAPMDSEYDAELDTSIYTCPVCEKKYF